MESTIKCSALAAGLVLGLSIVSAHAGERLPVQDESPVCAHKKLGVVTIEAGSRVTEVSMDRNPSPVNYARAFDRLAEAAAQRGGNAVVLRRHRATYYTRSGKRTPEAVHVRLSGAAIHLEGDPAACRLVVADPRECSRRRDSDKIVQTTSDKAYQSD
jgi:hypothetical protein